MKVVALCPELTPTIVARNREDGKLAAPVPHIPYYLDAGRDEKYAECLNEPSHFQSV